MGKYAFQIVAIKPGMESKYREFWFENKQTSTDCTDLHSAMLADTDIMQARNKAEALDLAKKKFPGRTIASVNRIG